MRASARLKLVLPAKPASKASSRSPGPGAGSGLLTLQRDAGNRAVNLALQRQAAAGAVGFDPEELELRGKTPGAGFAAVQREVAAAPVKIVGTAVIFKEPEIIRKPAADIQAEHGKKGVAGWTTPWFDIKVPVVTENEIQARTEMGFKMELDNTYRSGVLSVLQDHEQGHVRIGQEKGKAIFGDQLSNAFNALPDFKHAKPIRDAINSAGDDFVAQEGAGSKAYDDTDYARMVDAYYGATNPLSKLVAGSSGVRRLTNAMWSLMVLSGKKRLTSANVSARAEAVAKAREDLPDDDLARLQYNLGFKGYVARCNAVVAELKQRSDLDEDAQGHLVEAGSVLGDFVWKVDDVLITAGAI